MASRNVLFITLDQFRADCLHGALADHVDLPNLQALRREAVTFTQHYSVCNPCGPARASLLTGQYAMNHRSVRNGTPLRHDTPNLATELRKLGCVPLLYGYTDCSQDPRALAADDPRLRTYEEVMPGFEEVVEMRMEQSAPWRADLAAKGYDVPEGGEIWRPSGPRVADPTFYAAEDSDTAFLTDKVIEDLPGRAAGWCAHVTYLRPHPPFVAPSPYNEMYAPGDMPAIQTGGSIEALKASHPFLAAHLLADGANKMVVGDPELPPGPDLTAQLRALYLGLATEVDHHIGRIFDALKEAGLWENTLVVVTADHGEMLGDHHEWGKVSYHDAAFHVPLIIRDPDHADQHGTEVSKISESIDVTPTILDWMGGKAPHSMDGISLIPYLRGQNPKTIKPCSFSEIDFGNPIYPSGVQKALGLDSSLTNFAILREGAYRLVHFAADIPQILLEIDETGGVIDRSGAPDVMPIFLDLSRKMLCHRMANADGLFARTMITPFGPMVSEA